MSSSPAYYLHLSNENDVIADTDTPSEQEPLSSISDTELDAFENSCNDDADFNDFLNNFVQGKRSPTLQDHSDNVHDALSLAPEDTTTTQTHYNEPTTLENENALSPNPESKTTTTTKKRKQRGVSEHGGVEGAANFSLTTWHVSSPPRDREGSWLPVVVSPSERKGDGNDDETAPTPTLEKKDNKTVALESATLLQFDENIGLGCEGKKEFDEDEEAMAHEKLCSTTTTTTTTNSKWDDNWQQKFSELQSFKQENGHIHVSVSNENTRSLGLWLYRQRIFVRHYEATSTTNQAISYKHRYELLLSIGLTGLGARDMAWETTFEELLAYRSKHHTCNVPTKGTSLGRWVSKMRKQYKTYHFRKEIPDGWNDKMESRYHRLKEAGFVFCAAENKK